MFKTVKVYLKNSKELQDEEIYCLRVGFDDGLSDFKNKIFMRSPQLKNQDPQIYWFDLENDKIVIACDDDLKFFMEESKVHKITFDFHQQEAETSRKRTIEMYENSAEGSKRIRKQLEDMELGDMDLSDSSSMDGDSEDEKSSSSGDKPESSAPADPLPSTSAPKVDIISIEVISPEKSTPEPAESTSEVQIVDDDEDSQVNAENPEPASSTEKNSSRPETSGIVISDSSDEENTNDNPDSNSRRHSDNPRSTFSSSYAYSFANGRGTPNEPRQNRFRHRHSGGFSSFYDQTRGFQNFQDDMRRTQSENFERIQENARMAREHAARVIRASASAIPDIVTTFRSHFTRPMFTVSDLNQQIFGNFGRR